MTETTDLLRQPTRDYSAYRSWSDGAEREGWSDGLPMVPPTGDRVARFLEAAQLEPGDLIGPVPTREVICTAEQVAVNAVMAGCRPEYMPVVVAAVRAHLDPRGNSHATTASLAGPAHAVIINGPVRRQLGVNCTAGCFGPGARANATTGRALRLVIRNVCRGVPGFADRAAFSTPARYSFCFGEDEEGSPWEPLHVVRGFEADDDVVTVASTADCFALRDVTSTTPEALLERLAHLGRARPIFADDFVGDERTVVVVIGPEHRDLLVRAGWTKSDVRGHLHTRFTAPHTRGEASPDIWGHELTGGPTESSFWLPKIEGVLVIAAGGPGLGLSWILYPHLSTAVSLAV
jgi:hypothetical protein